MFMDGTWMDSTLFASDLDTIGATLKQGGKSDSILMLFPSVIFPRLQKIPLAFIKHVGLLSACADF